MSIQPLILLFAMMEARLLEANILQLQRRLGIGLIVLVVIQLGQNLEQGTSQMMMVNRTPMSSSSSTVLLATGLLIGESMVDHTSPLSTILVGLTRR